MNGINVFSAKLVKELRDKTGAGMMDCKKALAATDGDASNRMGLLRERFNNLAAAVPSSSS